MRREVKRKCWVRSWISERANDENNTLYKLQKELEVRVFVLADDKADVM